MYIKWDLFSLHECVSSLKHEQQAHKLFLSPSISCWELKLEQVHRLLPQSSWIRINIFSEVVSTRKSPKSEPSAHMEAPQGVSHFQAWGQSPSSHRALVGREVLLGWQTWTETSCSASVISSLENIPFHSTFTDTKCLKPQSLGSHSPSKELGCA